MNVRQINEHLLRGSTAERGLFPHVDGLRSAPFVFVVDFGLAELPEQPGVLLVRGPRQYGKSTWLEAELKGTVESYGPATAFYLNGDELPDADALIEAIRELRPSYRADAPVRRLFLDEVTAVRDWERGLKRLIDGGELRDVLVVTTGSRSTDLRRGVERLPGRKGRLDRTSFFFTPLSFVEFRRVCGDRLGDDTLIAYLLSGGCPLAAGELASTGRIPEFVVEMVRDWILGECAAVGRERSSLLAVWNALLRRGGTTVGQAAVAREAGLANNTVAAGYLELLADLMCVGTAYAWDVDRGVSARRKPAKFPPINLLAALAFDRSRLRSVDDFRALSPEAQERWLEWLVAQEIAWRSARRGELTPDVLHYWRARDREVDFVVRPDLLVEVKRGRANPLDYGWVAQTFPGARLWLVGTERFETDAMRGLTHEDLLLDDSW